MRGCENNKFVRTQFNKSREKRQIEENINCRIIDHARADDFTKDK